jgi:hypothetical protein
MIPIKIFLASSAELDYDKEQVELFISRKNKVWREKRIFLELTTWKDFISAMTGERKQDEYNQYIRSCDIAIFLFDTKLGRYTKEEFDHAHDAFRQCKSKVRKPLIYTYFKKEINESQAIDDFRKYIDSLDHFYDTYANMDELFVKFDRQLDLLESKHELIKPEPIDTQKIIKYAVYYFLLPLLVLLGGFFSFYYFQPTNLTVRVREVQTIPALPFHQGKIALTYGDKTDNLEIKDEVIFKQIPSKYKRSQLKLRFEARGFVSIDTLLTFSELIELPIRRDNSLAVIFGSVKDERNLPIKGVTINLDEIKSITDERGNFRLNIPYQRQAEEQRITAYKQGYKPWDFSGTPSQTTGWKIILAK